VGQFEPEFASYLLWRRFKKHIKEEAGKQFYFCGRSKLLMESQCIYKSLQQLNGKQVKKV